MNQLGVACHLERFAPKRISLAVSAVAAACELFHAHHRRGPRGGHPGLPGGPVEYTKSF